MTETEGEPKLSPFQMELLLKDFESRDQDRHTFKPLSIWNGAPQVYGHAGSKTRRAYMRYFSRILEFSYHYPSVRHFLQH
jgi:hypothetical protein